MHNCISRKRLFFPAFLEAIFSSPMQCICLSFLYLPLYYAMLWYCDMRIKKCFHKIFKSFMIGECVPNPNSIMTELLLLPHCHPPLETVNWELRTENHPRVAAPTSHSRLLRQSDSCLAVRVLLSWIGCIQEELHFVVVKYFIQKCADVTVDFE